MATGNGEEPTGTDTKVGTKSIVDLGVADELDGVVDELDVDEFMEAIVNADEVDRLAKASAKSNAFTGTGEKEILHLTAVGVSAPSGATTTTTTGMTNHHDVAAAAATTTNNNNTNMNGQSGRHPTVAQLVEGMDMLPPPLPGLRRGTPNTRIAPTQPGAYAGTMAGNFERMNHMDPNAVGNHPAHGLATLAVHHQNTHTGRSGSGNDGLVEAREVDDDEENANPALPMAREYKPSTNKKGDNRAIGIMIVLAMLALLLSLYFGIKNNNESSQEELVPTSPSPTSLSPSLSPSAAPSGIMEDLLDILPDYTMESLQDSSSPQFQAWQWLQNHHNITGMLTWRKEQLFAMATFYFAMDGENWVEDAKRTWMNYEVSECLWFSTITGYVDTNGEWIENLFQPFAVSAEIERESTNCDGNGRIKAVALQGSAAGVAEHAHVPPEICMLSSLILWDLSLNQFGGKLESFMPIQLFEMTNLRQVVYWFNLLSGSIPTAIGQLTNLQGLTLLHNSLTGTIPSEIGRLTSLQQVDIYSNPLTGTLPTEFGLLKNMTRINSSWTLLSGSLPTELGQCESLESLQMHDTPDMSGPIPSELGEIQVLRYLILYQSSFTGAIPSELGLTNTSSLQLDSNFFSGVIPSELGLMESLGVLLLADNGLTGTIPGEILQFESMISFRLSSNPLSGPIPTIGGMSSVLMFELEETHLSGHIPSEIGLLTSATWLRLSNNPFLTGPLPTEIGLLTDLVELKLANNTQLTGTIPSELGRLVSTFNLSVVHVIGSGNLTGKIEESLCFLQSPNCTYNPWWSYDSEPCALKFDCHSGLCGCDCDCPLSG